MGKLFDADSPVMRFLGRMGDLMILNLLVTLCSLPIVTIGASLTAMHYVMLKLVRGEEGYITKDFFKSFRMNFKQATIIWLIMLLFLILFGVDYYLVVFSGIGFPKGLNKVLTAIAILLVIASMYVFPVLSRFDNTVRNTIKNGFIMSIMALPKSLVMTVLFAAPVLVLFLVPRAIPLVLLFGTSLPGYLSAMLYSQTFRKFEPQQEEVTTDEEFHVVMDEEDKVQKE